MHLLKIALIAAIIVPLPLTVLNEKMARADESQSLQGSSQSSQSTSEASSSSSFAGSGMIDIEPPLAHDAILPAAHSRSNWTGNHNNVPAFNQSSPPSSETKNYVWLK